MEGEALTLDQGSLCSEASSKADWQTGASQQQEIMTVLGSSSLLSLGSRVLSGLPLLVLQLILVELLESAVPGHPWNIGLIVIGSIS